MCYACRSLGLECHGYDLKPEWMDKGALQKEQALKIKHFVAQAKLKQRKQAWINAAQLPQASLPGLDPLRCGEMFSSIQYFSGPKNGTVSIQKRITAQEKIQSQFSVFNGSNSHKLIPAASFYSNFYQADNSSTEDTPYLDPINTSHAVRDLKNLDVELYSATPASYNENFSSDSSASPRYFSTSGFALKSASPTGSGDSMISGDSEDALLMYYLDQVFYIQYPFYCSANKQGRGWLFSILKRAKSAFHATLALSDYHQHSVLPENSEITIGLTCLTAKNVHYNFALRELQLFIGKTQMWSGTAGVERSIEALTCILQLLFWEVRLNNPDLIFKASFSISLTFNLKLFTGGRENWGVHLGAVASLVPSLVSAHMASIMSNPDRLDRLQRHEIFYSKDDTAVRFLLGSFIWFDIISGAFTRSSHFLDIDHKAILDKAEIQLESIMGCRNWAMVLILEISLLDEWKQQAEKVQKLSITELAKRGVQIEEGLRENLVELEKNYSQKASSSMQSIQSDITRIFALSALTYLHVVMSGALPELPEIIESVSKTIIAFQSLSDAKLLRNLVWPFFISGCLALERQQPFFQGLLSAAEITPSTVGSRFQAFEIMKECWKARKTFSRNYDWVSLLKKRSLHVILL